MNTSDLFWTVIQHAFTEGIVTDSEADELEMHVRNMQESGEFE